MTTTPSADRDMRRAILLPRLRLDPFDETCISPAYLGWLNDRELMRYSENRHRSIDRAAASAYLARQRDAGNGFWAIRLYDGAHIGNVTADVDRANLRADIGILIGRREVHGRGFAGEAWRGVMAHLFASGIRKVEAGCMAANRPMLAIFGSSGMIIEGRRVAHFQLDGAPVDLILAGKQVAGEPAAEESGLSGNPESGGCAA
jgi:[ribosomal protein S5]-alanine N-acetyltransferase